MLFRSKLLAAARSGQVSAAQLDDNVRRLTRLILRCGLLDGTPPKGGELRTPRHRAIARRAASRASEINCMDHDSTAVPGART